MNDKERGFLNALLNDASEGEVVDENEEKKKIGSCGKAKRYGKHKLSQGFSFHDSEMIYDFSSIFVFR